MNLSPEQPIGLFDSGVGGLTVASAIKRILPNENIIYFGDIAHLPYGDKSAESVKYYSTGISSFLLEQNCKVILVACNTSKPGKPSGSVPSLDFTDGQDHTFVLSNKISGFYVGHSQKENISRYEGWVVNENHYVLDYHLFADNKKLERHNINLFRYFPFGFERHFNSGTVEKFIFPDSLDIIVVRVENSMGISMHFSVA